MKPYYQDKFCTIYHGDCLEIMPELELVDLVLTDPPYGTEDLGGGYGRRQVHDPKGRNGRTIIGDKDLSILNAAIPIFLKISPNSYIFLFCAARRMFELATICQQMEYLGEIIWDKGTPGLGYTIRYTHENCLVYKYGSPQKPNKAILSISRKQVSHKNTHSRHPHEKPISFWLNVMNFPGEMILDPFMGTGSVLLAAKQLNRKVIGIEIEEKYCEIAVRRLAQEVMEF